MNYKYNDREHKATCLECGDEFEYGRNGRKFCCISCKNRYNNRRTQYSKAMRVKVMNVLGRNYEILDRLVKTGVTKIPVVELKQLGFNPDYVTSYSKVRRHDVFSCFDISFTLMASMATRIMRIYSSVEKLSEPQNISLHLQDVSIIK